MNLDNQKKLIDFTALGIDTKLFSPAASHYKQYGYFEHFKDRILTDKEFWAEEKRRCKFGYSVTGTKGITISITGEHYQYLNYCRIKLTEDEDKNKAKKVLYRKAITKEYVFPDFWDSDYIFYWCKIIARFGASDYPNVKRDGGITLEEFKNLHLPDEVRIKAETFEDEEITYTIYGSGKNMVIGKKRRAGYSYKMGNSASRRYHHFKKSGTLLCAYDNSYLLDDALMTKAVECIDFVDANTPFTKRRIINLDDHKQAGYKENTEIEGGGVETLKGSLSQVIATSFRANKGAARGKDCDEIDVEECGKAPNLIAFSDATIDALSDGIYASGQIIWFGTGGGDNLDWEGFKEIFYNPRKYNCLELENVWDEGAAGTYCGMFIPDYWSIVGYITENGESLIELSKEYETQYQEEEYIKRGDTRGLIVRRMEHPHSPAEAFAISSSNIFDVLSIREWRLKVEREQLHISLGTVGKFVIKDDGSLKFEVDRDNELTPFWEYPVDKNNPNKKGAIVLWYEPLKTNGIIPSDRYIIDVDTYRYDNSTGDSVGACYVKIRPSMNVPHNLDNRLVAQYIGRPRTKAEFCKIVFQLADYYNAKIAYENDDDTLHDYAKVHKLNVLRYFENQFQLAFDEKLKTQLTMKRKFGMHIGSGKLNLRKSTGDEYIKDFIEEVRATYDDGTVQLNLHTIYDIGLLKELEAYNPEKGNFDRIAAFRIMMYHDREITYSRRQEKVKERQRSEFFGTKQYA